MSFGRVSKIQVRSFQKRNLFGTVGDASLLTVPFANLMVDARNRTYPIPIPWLESISEPVPMLESIPIPELAPDPILKLTLNLESYPEPELA